MMNSVEPARTNDAMLVDEIRARWAVFVHDLEPIIVCHREFEAVPFHGECSAFGAAFHVNCQQFRAVLFNLVVCLVQLN